MRDMSFSRPDKKKSNRRRKSRAPVNWKKRLRFSLMVAVYMVSFAAVLGGGFFGGKKLMHSDCFRLDTIHVENNSRVARDRLLAAGDIRPGLNLFDLDPAKVGQSIEQLPWVRAAHVERQFPHDLRIRIEERAALAIVKLDHLYYVDARADLFKVLESGDRLDYPVITGMDRNRFIAEPEAAKQKLKKALDLLQAMEGEAGFGSGDVSEIHVGENGGVYVFSCPNGIPIRFGQDDFRLKLDRLEKVYPQLKPRLSYLKYVDLNVLDRVVVKFDAHRLR